VGIGSHLQEGEEILYQAYPSRVPLLPPLTLAAVAALAGLVGWNLSQQVWVLVLAGAVVAVALVMALARYVRLAACHYVLTDRRLLRLRGILSQSSMDSYLDKINNVEHHQTLWGRLLGYGDVEIDTASESGAEVFPQISQPLAFKRAVDAATAAYHATTLGAAGVVGAGAAAGYRQGPAAVAAAPSGAERIRELKRLLDEGLITQAEFEAKRKQLLDQI
jgi:membrane protein YdbS with pleckstrin-like domain